MFEGTRLSSSPAPSKARFTLRWVLGHEPTALFEPAAREFARLVHEGTAGELRVDVMSLSDYAPGRRLSPSELPGELAAGRLEMAQTYTHLFGRLHAPLLAFDVPFIFSSHEHASRVFDGPLGRSLMDGLSSHGLRALAFTYSGGYRVIASAGRTPARAADLRGLRVRTSESPVAAAALEAMGAVPVPAPLERVPALAAEGRIDAAELTYPRYRAIGGDGILPAVCETGHSLLTTMVVASERFLSGLPAPHRKVLEGAALAVAREERAFSVSEGERVRESLRAEGRSVVALDDAEKALLKTAAAAVLPRIEPLCGGRATLDALRAA